ncbi:c-type cytochrome [Pararobbsia silviterrae]|uniref:Cytochrome c5 family protein n=1 Tax=Pararobbsia silviterrae TaxID=1792498 RepID=A0A494Y6T3_9BURK|nr:c-type cytochrome [Pararobbsia silviterrae]RKP58431.1 cytochrome c5 family protein [Pararobbsia silviterrae]
MSDEHQSPIKTPGQLIAVAVASFLLPIIVIVLMVQYVQNMNRVGAGTDAFSDDQVKARIAPVAQLTLHDANAPHVFKTGEEVFKAVCTTCHTPGAAGAPKFGDAGDWAPRIAQGYDTLLKNALSGKGNMPPRGGTSPDDYSDYEIGRAIVYMANNSSAHFDEPAAPAPGAAPAAAAAASGADSTNAGATDAASAAAAAIAAIPAASSAPAAAAGGSADAAQAGKALYTSVCATCHGAGLLGAPKFGDAAAWAPRLKDPIDTVYNYALHGKGQMPPKGGSTASDDDVKAAVDYMVAAAKGS